VREMGMLAVMRQADVDAQPRESPGKAAGSEVGVCPCRTKYSKLQLTAGLPPRMIKGSDCGEILIGL
jgi:hypothetical protein